MSAKNEGYKLNSAGQRFASARKPVYKVCLRIGTRNFNAVIDTSLPVSRINGRVMSYLAELGIQADDIPGRKKVMAYRITAKLDCREFVLCAHGKKSMECEIRLGVESLAAIGMIVDYYTAQRWYRDDPLRVINFKNVANKMPLSFKRHTRLQNPLEAEEAQQKVTEVVQPVMNCAQPQEDVTQGKRKRKKKIKVRTYEQLIQSLRAAAEPPLPQVQQQPNEVVQPVMNFVEPALQETNYTEPEETVAQVNEGHSVKRKEVENPEIDAEAKPVKKKVRKGRLSEAEAINVILSSVPEGYANPWQS